MESVVGPRGRLQARVIQAPGPGLWWRVRNLRNLWRGTWRVALAKGIAGLTGIPVFTSELRARLRRADGSVVNFAVIARLVVTDVGVAFLVDDWDDDSTDITNMNFHACGTGVGAEAAGDTALGTESTTITDREEGVKSQPAANQLRTVATQSFTGSGAITEHGLFSVITESTGVLWDRSVFSEINVDDGDSVQWTYTCTVSSGG